MSIVLVNNLVHNTLTVSPLLFTPFPSPSLSLSPPSPQPPAASFCPKVKVKIISVARLFYRSSLLRRLS